MNTSFFQAYPSYAQFLPRLSKPAAAFFQAWPRLFRKISKVIQPCPRLSKVILEKKDCLFLYHAACVLGAPARIASAGRCGCILRTRLRFGLRQSSAAFHSWASFLQPRHEALVNQSGKASGKIKKAGHYAGLFQHCPMRTGLPTHPIYHTPLFPHVTNTGDGNPTDYGDDKITRKPNEINGFANIGIMERQTKSGFKIALYALSALADACLKCIQELWQQYAESEQRYV